jgi:hypothetical protein
MGTVYLAEDKALQRYVALKVLLGNLARNPSLVKSLQLEAKAAAPLQHPNIVRIFSAGMEKGTPYIAMEYVEGEPLDRFLKRNVRLHWITAFYIGLQVAEALRYTHSRGVIHRDVKPPNILLDRHGRARLTDFGIANIQAEDDLAEASGFLGTPHYMPPEQCEGRPVSGSSDLYSLGITLYQMITGELPFTAESPIALVKTICSTPAPRITKFVPDVPDDVARLVDHLLQKRPEDRPRNAEEVCRSMARIQQEGGGKSALSSALNAFIREQAQIRTLPVVAQREAERRAPRGFVRRLKRRITGPAGKSIGAVALMALFATAPLLTWNLSPVHGRAMTAPSVRNAAFDKMNSSVRIARLPVEGYRSDGVAWVGDERVVLARVAGLDGALTQGASGLCALDPKSQNVWSVRPPAGGVFEPNPARIRTFDAWSLSHPNAPADAPLHNTLLVQLTNEEEAYAAVAAQSWSEAGPNSQLLYRTPVTDPARPHPVRHVAAAPDGYTICMLLGPSPDGDDYLVERDTRWPDLERVGDRLSPFEGAVLPESIQYTPDGAQIVFTMEKTPALRELWRVPAGGTADLAIKLYEGALAGSVAFSPDGQHMAVSVDAGADICLLNVATGAEEARLGPGLLGAQSWHPNGGYVLAVAGDTGGPASSLWAVETAPPYRRIPLETPAGIAGPCAVSRDGVWAAAAADGTLEVTTVFMRLNTVRFDG